MALGEIAYLSPWIFAPLVIGLAEAWRKRRDERRLFLLCLALPPIVLFTLTPLWGARGLPHWTMPGWFFAFALMGAWVDDRATADRTLRRWAIVSSGLLAARRRTRRRAGRDRLAAAALAAAARRPTRRWRPSTGASFATRRRSSRRRPSFCRRTGRTQERSRSRSAPTCPCSSFPTIPAVGPMSRTERRLLGRDGVLVARPAEVAFGARGRGAERQGDRETPSSAR